MTQDELLALIDQAAAEGWTELDLSGQGLTELPEAIGKLTQLETLVLGKGLKNDKGNQKYGIEQIDGKPQVVALVSGNALTVLPPSLAHLSNLKTLELSGLSLKELPGFIDQFSQLEILAAVRSQISQIPDSLAQLQSLQQLYLSSNQITQIPDSLAQLQSLQQLYLSANQIT
ncbi:MAG: leucine-rich repeat domain-containing protein, partial [Cyanobacteria bacterium P01_D01_bin.14]